LTEWLNYKHKNAFATVWNVVKEGLNKKKQ